MKDLVKLLGVSKFAGGIFMSAYIVIGIVFVVMAISDKLARSKSVEPHDHAD